MSRARSVAVLLTAITLAAPGAALGQGNGAGDEEYGDPFTEEPSGGSTTSGSQTGGSGNGLSQDPNLGIEGSSDPLVPPDPGSEDEATGTSLPNTGSDPRLLILAGGSLLLAGVGLRLRTADEDF